MNGELGQVSISPGSEDSEPCDTRVHLSAAEINTTLADGYRGEKRRMSQTAMGFLNKLNCTIKLRGGKKSVYLFYFSFLLYKAITKVIPSVPSSGI